MKDRDRTRDTERVKDRKRKYKHWWIIMILQQNKYYSLLSPPAVNEGGVKQVSNDCSDPGEPENGRRLGDDFR